MSATIETAIPTGTYVADPVHSTFGFQVRHNGVQLFRSRFTDVNVVVKADGDSLSIEGQTKVESIDIADPNLKGHLLSPDFFDAAQHPEVAFRSTSVALDGDQLRVEGELTMHGVTNHVAATGTLASGIGISGGQVAGLTLETVVDRTQYGLNWNAELPKGGPVLANEVKITVEAELTKQDA